MERNRKWTLPGLILICLLAMALFFVGVSRIMKSSGAYTGAIVIAQKDALVISILGEPAREGFFVTGTVNTSGPTGEARLSAPINGPKGEATLHIVAHKEAGQWQFERLVLEEEATGQFHEIAIHHDRDIQSAK
jgi:hypothetical protein